jgi:predicted XRE-type DNA-binding protein
MARDDDIREEVLSWAEESDEVLLEHLGRKLVDDGPLGFMGGGFSAPASFAQDARSWLNKNTSRFVEEYNDNNGLDDVELAVSLADVLYSLFPAMPFGPLSLLVARRITNRRSATYEAPEIEGVPKEEADPVSDNSKLDATALSPIFEEQLNREAMVAALKAVLAKERLSEQKAADLIGVKKNEINRARSGAASIEKVAEILTKLGYPPKLTVPGLD